MSCSKTYLILSLVFIVFTIKLKILNIVITGVEKMGDLGKLLPGKFSKFWEMFENFLIKMYDPGKSERVNWLMHIKMQKLKIVRRRGLRLRPPKTPPDRKPRVKKGRMRGSDPGTLAHPAGSGETKFLK